MPEAGFDHVACSPHGAGLEITRPAPHGGTDMEDRRSALDCMVHDGRVTQVADHHVDAGVVGERRYRLAYQYPHALPAGAQGRHQLASQETCGASHQVVDGRQRQVAGLQLLQAQAVRFRAGRFQQACNAQGVLARKGRRVVEACRVREFRGAPTDAG